MSDEIIIKVSNLVKEFNNSKAINDISFEVKSGRIIGIVGPDGAGKTTLLRLLIGLLDRTSGSIEVCGLDPTLNTDELHSVVGYMPQKFGLYEDLTVQENLELYAELKKLSDEEKKESFERLLKFTGLQPFTGRLAGRLSGGMKQKLGLACSLLGTPKVLLLDEPGVGVDPISRRELMKMVRDLSGKNMTILWSTSYLDEAENFDEVLVLNEGDVLYDGKPKELTNTMEGKVFLTKGVNVKNRTLLRKILKSRVKLIDAVIQGDAVRVAIDNAKIINRFKNNVEPTKPRFEDAVMNILGGCEIGESKLIKGARVENCDIENVVEARGLTKVYGSFTAANDITFSVKKGEIFGLLGPNGAGKSTTFKMLCGLSSPTRGKAFITGINMSEDAYEAKDRLGYMAQKFSLSGTLTVKQNLEFFAGIYGLTGRYKQERIEQMIETFEFQPYLKTFSSEIPLGFKQRLSLACAIMHVPPVLFLDEPTSGVDPLTRRDFWNHINSMAEIGTTVVVTTHFMDEAEYCDKIALIYKGQAIKVGTPNDIKVGNETMEDAFIRTIIEYDKSHEEIL